MMKSKRAFTLAEVLITLGIIGVVATLTLPNVMANYAKKSQVAQLQRAVNAVSSAMGSYMLDSKTDNFADTKYSNDPSEFFTDYLGSQYIGTYSGSGLNSAFKKYYKLVGSTYREYPLYETLSKGFSDVSGSFEDDFRYRDFACGKLVTGATVCMSTSLITDSYRENAYGYSVIIDVNSDAGPNIFGRDLFTLGFNKKGKVMAENYGYEYCNPHSYGGEYYCFSKILSDGWEMNY